jgi:hypothetical protein
LNQKLENLAVTLQTIADTKSSDSSPESNALQRQVGDLLATVKREDDDNQPFEGSSLFHDHLQDVVGVFGGRITPPPQDTHIDSIPRMGPAASIESITDIAKLPLPPSNCVLVAMRYARSTHAPRTIASFPD